MRTRFRTKKQDEAGAVLVTGLLIMGLLALLGSAFLTLSNTERLIATNEMNALQAFYIAEAGLQKAINQLSANPSYTGETLSFGGGEFVVAVASTGAACCPNQKRIESIGYIPGQASPRAVKRLSVLVDGGSASSPFQRAITSGGTIYIAGGAIVDSYDSSLGAYGGSNVTSRGHVRGNSSITISGTGTTVKGDVTAVGSVTVSSGASVTGTITQGASPLEIAAVDASYKEPNSNTTGISPSGNYTYDSTTHDLKVLRRKTISLAEGTYYFNKVTLESDAVVIIQNKVTIYATGDFSASAGKIDNQTALPSNFTLYSSGLTVALPGGYSLYGVIYAPNATITIGPSGSFYSSIIGGGVDNRYGSKIHYDEALRNAGESGSKFTMVLGSWTER